MDSNNFTFHTHGVNHIKHRQDLLFSKTIDRSRLNYFFNESITNEQYLHLTNVRFSTSHFNDNTELGNSDQTLFPNYCG